MPKVSILMPVYNVEKYLAQCMDSVLNQTLTDIEILCIDDGSKDSSSTMLDEYAAKDSRVRVIHKENTGYGHSMNLGIRESKGEYIGIVEPDDYIRQDMFEVLYKCAIENSSEEKLDFVKGNFFLISNSREPVEYEPFCKDYIDGKVITPRKYLRTFQGGASIWAAIYRRDFLINKEISFLETPGASFQDTGFYIKSIFEADSAIFIRKALYNYRIDNSTSSVKDNSKVFAIKDEFDALTQRYNKNQLERKILNSLKIEKYNWNFNRLNEKGKALFLSEYKSLIPIIRNHDYILEIIGKDALKYACRCLNINYSILMKIEYILLKVKFKILKDRPSSN